VDVVGTRASNESMILEMTVGWAGFDRTWLAERFFRACWSSLLPLVSSEGGVGRSCFREVSGITMAMDAWEVAVVVSETPSNVSLVNLGTLSASGRHCDEAPRLTARKECACLAWR